MKKPLLVLIALLCLAVPTALAAPPDGNQAAESAAEKACRAEQGTSARSKEAFADEYGTNKNKKNAFGKCVSSKSKEEDEDEADEDKGEKQDKMNASKKCKAERGTTAASIAAFANEYGTNKNKSKNAFGKCVSKAAKQKARTS